MSTPRSGIRISPPGPAGRVRPFLGPVCICLQAFGLAAVSGQTTAPSVVRLPGRLVSPTTPVPLNRSQPILSYHRDQQPVAHERSGPTADPPSPEQLERTAPIDDRLALQATTNGDMVEPANVAEAVQKVKHGNQLADMAPPPPPGPHRLIPSSKATVTGGRLLNGSASDAPANGRASLTVPSMDMLQRAGAALAIAVGLFLICAWLLRRSGPRANSQLPKEVVRALGRTQLATRQFVQLLQVGNKLVLVSVTPGRTEPITEVTDPAEVHRILGLCMRNHALSTTAEFQQVLDQLSREPASGFLGNEGSLATAGRNKI